MFSLKDRIRISEDTVDPYPHITKYRTGKGIPMGKHWYLVDIPIEVFQSTKQKLPTILEDTPRKRQNWNNRISTIFIEILKGIVDDTEFFEVSKMRPRNYCACVKTHIEPKTQINMSYLDNWSGNIEDGDGKHVRFSVNIKKKNDIYKILEKLEEYFPLMKEL